MEWLSWTGNSKRSAWVTSKTNISCCFSIRWICMFHPWKSVVHSLERNSISCSTFVCPTEIIAFSDRIQEFKDINTESKPQWRSVNHPLRSLLTATSRGHFCRFAIHSFRYCLSSDFDRPGNHLTCLFLAWINTPREQGGLGKIQIPLLSDLTHQISKDYGVYLQDVGHALRWERSG